MIWPDPTHPPTHHPNYTPTHGWGSLHRFQIFKQNWNISISSSAIEFWMILGVPPGGGCMGGWGGGGERVHPTHVHMHMHVHPHVYDIIGNSQGFPNGGDHLHEIIMFTMHACACVQVHAHMHVCGGHPPTTPTPRAAGSPKHQNSLSLELIEIIRFCLKILYLWTFLNSYRLKLITPEPPTHLPHPQSWGNPNRKNYNNSWTNRDNSILFKDLWPLNPPAHI